ncbi:60S ribosomal protein L31 [Candidatus Woesearchaeota archaeon]|nr:60S ribosomal protein L31 [Candidatus Woesearchaeota archaeon]
MADENKERIYVIPLRRAFLNAPIYKRTKRAVSEIRIFITRHMKVDEVRIGSKLNELLWKKGNENPPAKVKVKTRKIKEGKQEHIKAEQSKEEEKLLKEGKAKEEIKHGPEPKKKEELKTKQMDEKIERTKRISKTQKSFIKHKEPKQAGSKVGH